MSNKSLRYYDSEIFSYALQSCNFDRVYKMVDVNLMWDYVETAILNVIDALCQNKWKKIRKDKPPWFNSSVRELGNARDKLFRNFRRSKRSNKEFYRQGVIKRREFNRACKEARKNFFRDQLICYTNDQKKFWKIICELVSRSVDFKIERVFKYGTDTLLNEVDSVNEINIVFAEIDIPHELLDERSQF